MLKKKFDWPNEKKEDEVKKQLEKIKEQIDSGLSGLHMNLFLTLEQILEEHIKIYWAEFIASDLYKKALALYRLPPDLISDLEAKIKEEEKLEAEFETKTRVRFKDDDEVKVFSDPLSPTIDIDPHNKVVESNLRKFELTIEETEKEAEREKQLLRSRPAHSKSFSEASDMQSSSSFLSSLSGITETSDTSGSSSSESESSTSGSLPKLETST